MLFNISNPKTGQVLKKLDIEDDMVLGQFYDKRISAEIDASIFGAEWNGYVLKVVGGTDRQGFPMMQGVLSAGRVKLLFKEGEARVGFHMHEKRGQMQRKTVRGCIISPAIRALNLIVVRKGEADIAGLTDCPVNYRLQPQRANHIRKLYKASKEEDVTKLVTRRVVTHANGKTYYKAPKIQRLVTDARHKRKVTYAADRLAQVKRSAEQLKAFQAH